MSRSPGDTFVKDPDSIEPYGFNWAPFLAELSTGETITASTWSRTGADTALTLSGASIVTGLLETQVILTGGTLGLKYFVVNHITTSGGTQDDRSIEILIQQR